MWILRINMTDRSYKLEELPEEYKLLAGRGLTSTLIYDEVPPTCHPLGPNNKLIFAPGIVTGTAAPTSARISVGAKSPLTGGIKESNAGSEWPQALARMRIRALVVEGQPKKKGKFWMALLSWDDEAGRPKVEFLPADEYTGLTTQEAYNKAFMLAHDLRTEGLRVEYDHEGKSLKAQMRKADNFGVAYVLILGEDEIKSGRAILKDMKDHKQDEIGWEGIVQEMRKRLKD